MTIPTTCPDFVSHPHIVEITRRYKDAEGNTTREEKKEGYCYTCQEASASETQGTSAIAEALIALGIPADVHQTGGFTMCVYIKTGDESYIYANAEGFSMYRDAECEGFFNAEWANAESTPEAKAEGIRKTLEVNNLEAKELTK
jgi:hypothetical protein